MSHVEDPDHNCGVDRDVERRRRCRPAAQRATSARSSVGKAPIGKYPVGKAPIGKYPQPVVSKG